LGSATHDADKEPVAGKKCRFFSMLDADKKRCTDAKSKKDKSESFATHNAYTKPDTVKS
jgi:hypothetical protein